MKIIFAGTPDFAAVALKHLIDAGHEIALVLSQPDRPSGRGMKLTPSPVKKLALEHGIPVITPVTLSLKKAPEESARIHADLKAVGADLLVVAAYGLILPQAVLDCAKGIGRNGDIRALNIHGTSLITAKDKSCKKYLIRFRVCRNPSATKNANTGKAMRPKQRMTS